MICEPGDVVAVPFPFTDRPGTKRRPALVMSARLFNSRGHSVMAMITTKSTPPWPGDHHLVDLGAAGLMTPSLVRIKLFTIDNRLIVRRIGRLARADRTSVAAAVAQALPRLDAGR